jgi:hypothetical protein
LGIGISLSSGQFQLPHCLKKIIVNTISRDQSKGVLTLSVPVSLFSRQTKLFRSCNEINFNALDFS